MIRLDDHKDKFSTSIKTANDLKVSYLVEHLVYPDYLVDLTTEYLENEGLDFDQIVTVRKIMLEALYLQKIHMVKQIESRIENLKVFEL